MNILEAKPSKPKVIREKDSNQYSHYLLQHTHTHTHTHSPQSLSYQSLSTLSGAGRRHNSLSIVIHSLSCQEREMAAERRGGRDELKSGQRGRILRWEGPPPPALPETNYADYLLQRMATHDGTAVVESETGKHWTFSQLCELVPRVAGGLAASGVGLGDRVLCLTPVHVDYPLSFLAVMYRGAIVVPISPTINTQELAHVLRVSEARWAVVHEASVSLAEAAYSHLPAPTLEKMWVVGSTCSGRATLNQLLSHSPVPPVTKAEGLVPDKMAAVMPFSSGTTGLPKGVLLSHTSLHVPRMRHLFLEQLIPERAKGVRDVYRRTLLLVPLTHIYGQSMLEGGLFIGTTTVCITKFTPTAFLNTIQKYQITACPLVPHLIKYLSDTPLLKKYDISSLIAVFSAGAPIDGSTLSTFGKKTGVAVGRAYGMTETNGAVTATRPPPDDNPDTVGKVLPYAQVKVIDDVGEVVGEGVEGEVCAWGPGNMLGYANNQTATSATLDSEGWVHTGDVGYYDQNNFLYITDRRKDLIKVKGHQVAPYELEQTVKQHKGVSDAAVVGVPHPTMGEAPRAFIVLKPDARVTTSQIQSFVADRVASYKRLAGGVRFVDTIPRSPTGKILKKQLRPQDLGRPTASKL